MYKVTKSKLSLFFAIASFFFCSTAVAQTATSAYAGGDITYQYLSGDTIQVNLDYYVQCGGSSPTTNPFLVLRNCAGSVITNMDMGTPTITNISDVCSSVTTNCAAGSVTGRRRYRYSLLLDISANLGSNCNFYRLSISPPTRNTSANLNLASATNQRIWLQADLYLGNNATNNSPVFNAVGIPYAMASSTVVFNPQVTDVDGDSLVYSLVGAQSGITNAVNIPYSSGSGAAPISGITIDSETGILNFTSPASAGNYQVVIQVAEFDRTTGNQLSRTYRDMQFVVLSGTANAGPTAAANLTNLTNATLNSSYEVTLDSGVNGCFSLAFTGATGETVTINSGVVTAVLSGASVTNTAASNVTTSQICWTPGAGSVGRHVISLGARDNGCSANGYGAQKIIVNVLSPNQPLSTTATITNPTCNGTNDGTITVNVTGGTGPFSHTIFPPGTNQSSNVFTGLGANTYLIITIDSGANIEDTLFNVGVTNPSPFFLTGFSGNTAPTCETSCNGTATATTAGGAAGTKTFAWSTGGTGATQTNLCGGTYSVTVTDPNGCTVTGRMTQVRPPVVYADTDSTVVVTCNGGNDGEAYLSGHGGFAASTSTTSYIIDQSEGSFSPYGTSMSGTSNISGYQTFNLGDDATTSAVNIGFTFQFFGNNQTQFVISSNGNIQFGASGSNSFNNVAIPNSAVPNNWVGIWDDLNPGASTTEVIETYLITNTAGRRARVVNFVNVPHFNSGTASGLFNFQIVLYETSNVIEIHSTNVPTVTTESSNAGRTMGIENSGGTAGTAVTGRNSANWGATNDYVAFIPSAQTFTYTWSSLGTGASATNLTAGNYTVTVATSSCNDVVNFTITEPTPIVIDTVITNPSCDGLSDGQIAASASGGNGGAFTFLWNTGANTATVTGLAAGTYTVTATDISGCTESLSVTLVDPTPVTATLTPTNVNCLGGADGSISAVGSGGTGAITFAWSNGGTGSPLTGLTAGTYTVTATDANGCTGTATTTLTEPATAVAAAIASSTNESCSGAADGSITASGSGGTGAITFAWSNGGSGTTINGLTAATYTVTATDANGCTDTAQVTIISSGSTVVATVTATTQVLCFGGNTGVAGASATGGAGTVTFAWNTGGSGTSISGLTAGTYTVTATDANGCTGSATVAITQPASGLSVTATPTGATCNGGATGSATASGSGGTGAITFAWSTGGTGTTISSLTAATYTVTATDANGCTATATAVVTQPTAVTVSVTPTQPSCSGGTGSATASGAGGTGAITFAWSTGGTGTTISSLAAGTYTVTATDASGCTATATTTINAATAVTVSITSPTNVACFGGSTGSATAVGAGGSGTFTYAWSNGATGATASALTAGTYTVTATDGNSCTGTTTVAITQPASVVSVTVTTTNALCFGGSTGTATASGSGGTGAITFAWSTGGTGTTISSLAAATYTVTATDASGCTATATGVVTAPASGVSVTTTATGATCNGGATGSATASGSGGTGAITFAWSTGGTGTTISSLTAATYTVTATDANGCTATATALVTQPTAVTVSVTPTQPSCSGGTGSATASGAGGTGAITFAWNTGGTGTTISSLAAGTYTVTATDASGCTATATTTINAATAVTVSITSPTNVACFGGSTGSATAVGAGGSGTFTYAWSNGATGATASTLTAGTYTVTATDGNSCTGTTTVAITQPASAVSVSVTTTNALCFGGSTGTATASGSGGTGTITFAWSNSGTGATISSLAAGTYTVTATDASGCTATATGAVAAPAQLFAFTSVVTQPTCPTSTDGSIQAFGFQGTSPYTYLWNTGGTSATLSSISAGTYTVTVTDFNGCTDTEDEVLSAPNPIVLTVTPTNPTCSNGTGSATVSSSGGSGTVTFAWSTGGTGATISSLAAGTYTVTATDGNACTMTGTTTITAPTAITATIAGTNVACFGGSTGAATASASGGTGTITFAWNTGATGATITTLTAGTYTVTATDASACTSTATVTITQPASGLTVSATSTGVACFGGTTGTATATSAGGSGTVTFAWNTGGTGATITTLTAGTYTVTATDGGSCTTTSTTTISQPAAAVSASIASTNVVCFGASTGSATATGTGGTGTITFAWNTGGTGATISSLIAGTYTVTATDASGCTATATTAITQPATGLSVTTAGTNVTCNGGNTGSATATGAGGTGTVTFAWNTGGTGATISTLTAGTYTVTATDGSSCTATATVVIAQPASAVSVSIAATNATCSTLGSATATGTGGTGTITFAWNTGSTSATISSLTAATYTVTATDASGCTATASTTITSSGGGLTVSVAGTNVLCNGATTGTATATPTGGTGTITYAWSNSATGATITTLAAGTYTVTATDGGGCTATGSVTITQPASAVTASIGSTTNPSCFGGNNGQIAASGSGGTGTLALSWSNGATGSPNTSLTAGTYTVTVTDANGCTATASATLSDGVSISISMSTTSSLCFICSGSATAAIGATTSPYTYTWSNGNVVNTSSLSNQQSNLCSGPYSVTVTNANGCTATAAATVNDIFAPTLNTTAQDVSCFGACDGEVYAAYNCATCDPLEWFSFPDTSSSSLLGTGDTLTGICADTVLARLTTAFGCQRFDTVIVSEPTQVLATATSTSTGCTSSGGTATASGSGGTGSITFAWNTGGSGATITNLTAGTYTVTATDASGCTDTASVVVNSTSTLAASIASSTNVLCNAGTTGSATATSTGGTGTVTFAWNTGGSGVTISTLTAGTYTVTATDAATCTATATVTLTEPAVIVPTITGTNVGCASATSGSAVANPTGGTSPYTFVWNTGSTSGTASSLTAGTYTVTVTDNNSCTATESVTLTGPGSFTVATTPTNVLCFGGTTGQALATPSGGTSPFTYLWNNGQTAQTATALTAGTYTVTATDNGTCTATATVILTQPASAVVATIGSTTNNSCFGGAAGSTSVTGSGGTGTITFLWTTGSTAASITGLTAGSYTVTATDANGCTGTVSATITQPASGLTASISAFTNVACNAGTTGSATAATAGASGTPTFAWSNGGTGVTISSLTAGTYTVTATDGGGCTATASVTLTEPTPIVVNLTTLGSASCGGGATGSISSSPSGGTAPYTFLWSTGSTNDTISGLANGSYTVTVTDNTTCTTSGSTVVAAISNTVISPTILTSDTTVCAGTSVTVSGSNTSSNYTSTTDTLCNNGGGGGIINVTFTNAPANAIGTPTLSTEDWGKLYGTQDILEVFDENANLLDTLHGLNGFSSTAGCVWFTDSVINLTPAQVNAWSANTSISFVYDASPGVFSFCSGLAYCIVSTLSYETADAGLYWFEDAFTADTAQAIGQGTSINLNPTTTTTYFYANFNGLCWSVPDTMVITVLPVLTASIVTNTTIVCNGDSANVGASGTGGSGTYTFQWPNGATSASTNLPAGTWCVTVDDGVCSDTACVIITEPAALLANTSGINPGCAGSSSGSATANPTGGSATYTYLWNTTATTQSITGLAVGTYTVTVTDANSCTATGTVSIINPVPMNVSVAGTNVQCNAAATGQAIATVTGGTSPFTYLWNNGQTTDTASALTAGTYTVTVTDNGACTETGSVTVTEPATAVSVTFSGLADPSCDDACDGTATASATGGTGTLAFLWSTGSSATSVTSLCGGSHTVSVTDANGCEVSAMISLVEPPSIWAVLDSSNDVLCAGDTNGEAFLSAFGGFAASTSTAAYIVDQTEGEFEPYGYGQPANAVSYQTVTLADDATSAAINIFDGTANFSFFGNNFPQFVICSQGFITFNTALANQNAAGLYSNSATMPTAAQPNNFVAAFWEDLDPSVGNAVIETYLIGTAPNRVRVVNYINIDHFFNGTVGSGDTSTFQIVLYESSNIIQIHSEQLDPDAGNGGLHVQGIENAAGSAFYAVSGRNNVSFSATNDYVAFIPTTQNFTYTWSSIGSGSSATNLTGGNYIVTVSDGSCEDTISFVIDEPAPLAATFSALQPSSCSSCTGQATATISGGTAGYSLTWPNSQTSTSATLLCSGINEITVTDANFCIDSFSVVIVSDSADTVIATGTNPLCAASCDGTVTATTSSTGSTFVWINQATSSTVGTSATVTGLCAGTYIVQMTNTGGCVSSDTVTIVDPTGVTASIPSSTNVNCLGGNTGAATASAVGGTSPYVFTWPGAFTGTTITGLTAGTYTVTATDNNGCTSTASVTITEPATGLSVTAALVSNVSCFGDNDGSASATAAGGTGTITFTWNGTLNGTPITGLTAGTYTVVASDASSCTATSSVTITEPTDLVLSLTTSTDPSCPTILDGSATVAASGGTSPYTFSWPSSGTGTTETGLGDGIYCVTVTDFNLCTDILCVTITDPSSVTNTFSGIANSSCTVCDGTATANPTGGNGGTYTFLWSNGQTTAANDSLCAGFNNVTITDNGGCESVHTIGIGANGADTVFAGGVDANCGACDGIVFATYNCNNGPCTLEWTVFGSSTVLGTTDTLTSLCAETYAVELTNNAGCISTDTFTVNAPLPIDPNAVVNDATCGGALDGSILLTPSGGSGTYNYVWSNAAGNVANNTGLGAGTYTVTISDGSGCDTIASFVINDPSGITIATTITNASCFSFNDGSILATPSGGAGTYSYNWSPIPGNGQGVQLATGLTAGTYFLTVTDIDGCTAFDTSIVTEPTEIVQDSVNLSNATCGVCDGEIEVFISGGAGGYNYAWTNGDNTSIADSLCFGGYVLDVTDATGCSVQFNYPISETNGPTISITGTNTSANGECDGSALATVINSQGTVTFTWSNGDTGTLADSLCAGTYFVTATDVNGCNTVDTVIITEPGLLELTMSSTAITCEGGGCDGTATVAVSGGVSPYTFLWSSGGTAQTDTALCAGTYTVTVTDLNGITASASVTLDSPSPFTITSTVVNESCPGVCDGSISLNIIGGSAGATSILWSTGDTTSAITGLCPGSYYVIVSDTGGCEDSLNFNIIGVSAITATIDNIIEPDCQVSNGVIDVSAAGGNGGPYSFLWLDVTLDTLLPVQTTDSAINLFAGIYSVAITDINGCADTIGFVLNNNNAASIALDSINNVSCFGECDGAVFVSLSGGTTPYTILWSSGGTAEDDTALCAGADTIAVVDSLFCLSFEIYQITEPAELKLDQMLSTALTCGDNCDGMLEPTISGGTEPYTFLWSNGSTDTALVDLCAGIYGLTVTDANGCSFSTNAVVAGPTAIVITLDSANDATCSYTGDGNVFITVTGGTPGYTYAWGNGTDVLTGQDLTNALAGTYRLTLTDANGCVALDTFTVATGFAVEVTAMADFDVCPDSRDIPITGTNVGGTTARWLTDEGVVINNSTNALVDVLNGERIFILEGINGICVSRDTLTIVTTDGPGIDAGANQAIEPGDEVTIGGAPTANAGVEVIWTPSTDLSANDVFNPIANPLQTIVYYVSATDENGCFGMDSVVVTVEKLVDPVDGFSPNGDGTNDFFYIGKIERYPNAIVTIFNRWGNEIYQAGPNYNNNPWNGKFKGNELPVGSYYYVIDLKDAVAKEPISGSVVILK